MALTSKKYESIHNKTGADLTKIKANFDNDHHEDLFQFEPEAALLYQIQKMQEELDYLRTEISSNKSKSTFPGFGTTSSTALAGDTTTISISEQRAIALNTAKTGITTTQANAITANTAKTTFPGFGTSNSTALVGDTKLVGIGNKTTLSFGDMVETIVKGKATYTIVMSVTTDFGGKTGSLTKSITLTLT
tara:strand:- start:797 stop:1369 length:573 start_codon:yes stop_codon:yes gene_type:complete